MEALKHPGEVKNVFVKCSASLIYSYNLITGVKFLECFPPCFLLVYQYSPL